MKIPEQVARLGVVLGVLLVIVLTVRFVLIPPSYFSTARHQSGTIRHERAKPISFAGAAMCRECHEEVYQAKAQGYHKTLGCESCHGPGAKHVDDPMNVKPFAPRDRKFCPTCHTYDSARPTGFPQIDPTAHNPLRPCIACHEPHNPTPPEVPRECAACHQQIARTKALSSHALLPCTTCHTASDRHRSDPRGALPTKPETREFCGQCHGEGSPGSAEAPKIDVSTHGAPYLCWQCHYPHQPEGRP